MLKTRSNIHIPAPKQSACSSTAKTQAELSAAVRLKHLPKGVVALANVEITAVKARPLQTKQPQVNAKPQKPKAKKPSLRFAPDDLQDQIALGHEEFVASPSPRSSSR